MVRLKQSQQIYTLKNPKCTSSLLITLPYACEREADTIRIPT